MSRWLKIILKVSVGAVALVVLLWLGIALYVNLNKVSLLKQITAQLNEGMNGKLTIATMKPELVRGFPAISVALQNVVLRDSLYDEHHHDFLNAKNVYVAVNAFSVLRRAPRIMNIEISDGKLFLFTDSNGYSNTSIFRKKENVDTTRRKVKPRINHIFLNNVQLTFQNDHKLKLFNLDIHNSESVFNYNDTGWTARVNVSTFVHSLAFNTEKGSYAKNKELVLDLEMGYNRSGQILTLPQQTIKVGNEQVAIDGKFFFGEDPVAFQLNFGTQSIVYRNAKELLTEAIATKLNIIDIKEPLEVHASIKGKMKFRDTPLVHITWVVKNNILTTPAGQVTNCSFTGQYLNQVDTSAGHADDNSKIALYHFTGSYMDIPFSADTLRATNLIRPVIEGRFHAHFPLKKLNPVMGGDAFTFNNGDVNVNLLYKGGIMADDTTRSYIYGTVLVSSAAMTYLPRHLNFTNTSATVDFSGGDVYVRNARVQSGSTVLVMNGAMRNFLNLYYNAPDKIVLDWSIKSPRIDLGDFRSFLTTRAAKTTVDSAVASRKRIAGATRMSRQLDNVLAASSVNMQLQVDRLLYKDFTANNINADVQLAQSGINLNNVSVSTAGGKLVLRGNVDQRGTVNTFHVAANIDNVNIQEFFHSFSNFGQTAITDKNLQGNLYAKVDVTGGIKDDGQIVPRSFKGKVDFDVRNGALKDFGPFMKVGKYIFRNRNLNNVTFTGLKNTLEINGEKITINPMLIESSAINLQVRGVYSMTKGTDIDIDVPLRNPKKDEVILDEVQKQQRDMKGIVVHLKAVDGDDGSVKIKLKMSEQPDSTSQSTTPGKGQFRKRLLQKIRNK